ncbi:MAG: hypothetical protein AAGF24_04940 [Cyanobacteria bacterium P01_H01_bin.121]
MPSAPRSLCHVMYTLSTLSLSVPAAVCVDQQLAAASLPTRFNPSILTLDQAATGPTALQALLAQPNSLAESNLPLLLLPATPTAQGEAAELLKLLQTPQVEDAIAVVLEPDRSAGTAWGPQFTPNPASVNQPQPSQPLQIPTTDDYSGHGIGSLPRPGRFAPEMSRLAATPDTLSNPTAHEFPLAGTPASSTTSSHPSAASPADVSPSPAVPVVNGEPWLPLHRRQTFPGTNLNSVPAANAPGVTISNPSAQSLSWGTIGLGLGFQERTRFSNTADGGLGLGVGLGDAQRAVGVQVGLGLVDLSDLFADGSLSVEIHRELNPDWTIALGVNGLATWGAPDGGSSLYGVTTKRFRLRSNPRQPLSELTVSLGIGGGQFRSEQDILAEIDSVGIFGSAAVRIVEPVSGIVEWTGQDLTLGLSITPIPQLPLVLNPAVSDITGNAGDGARFIFGAGFGFRF